MKKFNNKDNNGRDFKGNGKFRKSKEEYEKEKAAQIASQNVSLDIISDTAEFLDNFLNDDGGYYKITMKEILTHLNEDCGYIVDQTKIISQFNYILMDMANARKNPHISGDRLNIRVMYIEERLKTSFKSELHDRIREIIKKYPTLFHWDEKSTGEDYVALPETPESDK